MSNNFTDPTQFQIDTISIDGNDVIGLFSSISIFENIYSPVITGSIVIMDSDGARFIEEYDIEFIEEIEFSFKNANDETLEFKGFLNGMRNEMIKNQKKMYTIDFTSKAVRENEKVFVTKRFNNVAPEDIAKEMVEKIGGTEDQWIGSGKPMSFLGTRKRPTKIIEYVLTHGVTEKSSASNKTNEREETTKGTTGFLCWETLDGHRFVDIDTILDGGVGTKHEGFEPKLANRSVSMEEAMKQVIEFKFDEIGDFQSKLRSGAFKNIVVSFDLDKGYYKEFVYDDTANMTEKQKEAAGDVPTRVMSRAYNNEMFENTCEKAQDNKHDQSRECLSQNVVRQNTFNDQSGTFTLPPLFTIRAGDPFDVKIPKVDSEKGGGIDKKHSGTYIIKQVGHHFLSDGRAYTKITTVRSTKQQDDATS